MADSERQQRRNQTVLSVGVVALAALGVFLYFSSASNAARREGELTKVIHAYEESVFLKKVEVYRNEVKRKEAELEQERTERMRLAEELIKANKQIDTANSELLKANKIIEDEAVAITEWKAKTTQLESDFFKVKRERDDLKAKEDELTQYAKKKDAALSLVMDSLQKTEAARQESEQLRQDVEARTTEMRDSLLTR